jgi:hypothetical protein
MVLLLMSRTYRSSPCTGCALEDERRLETTMPRRRRVVSDLAAVAE